MHGCPIMLSYMYSMHANIANLVRYVIFVQAGKAFEEGHRVGNDVLDAEPVCWLLQQQTHRAHHIHHHCGRGAIRPDVYIKHAERAGVFSCKYNVSTCMYVCMYVCMMYSVYYGSNGISTHCLLGIVVFTIKEQICQIIH